MQRLGEILAFFSVILVTACASGYSLVRAPDGRPGETTAAQSRYYQTRSAEPVQPKTVDNPVHEPVMPR